MSLVTEAKLSLEDLAIILTSIRVNVERVEKEKKKCRSTIDKANWQSTIDDYTKSYDKVNVSMDDLKKCIDDHKAVFTKLTLQQKLIEMGLNIDDLKIALGLAEK
jgi:predicted DNA-binding ArsR family transcriptional regulator